MFLVIDWGSIIESLVKQTPAILMAGAAAWRIIVMANRAADKIVNNVDNKVNNVMNSVMAAALPLRNKVADDVVMHEAVIHKLTSNNAESNQAIGQATQDITANTASEIAKVDGRVTEHRIRNEMQIKVLQKKLEEVEQEVKEILAQLKPN